MGYFKGIILVRAIGVLSRSSLVHLSLISRSSFAKDIEYHYDTFDDGGCEIIVLIGMSFLMRIGRRLGNTSEVKKHLGGNSYLRLKLERRRQTRSCIFSASLTGTLKLLAIIEKATGSLSPVNAYPQRLRIVFK